MALEDVVTPGPCIGYSQYSLLLSVGAVLCDVVTPVQERATVFQSCPCARTRESGLHFRVFWRSRVFYIFRRSHCPGTRDLPSSGMCFAGISGSRVASEMILARVGAGRDFGATPLACLAN